MRFFTALKGRYFAQCCLWILLIVAFAGIFAPFLSPYDPTLTNIADKYLPISAEHYLGTDQLGRDIFSRLVWGVRTSVFYGLAAMVLTLLIGLIVGCAAALGGEKIENVLMRFCDMMLSFPSEVMIFALVGIFGTGIEHILLAIVLVKWAWYARMIYGVAQQHRHKAYLQFSQTLGASRWHLFRHHLLPVMLAELVILGSADMGGILLMISALSFLGLGVQPPTPEWGVMLSDAKNAMLFYPEQMLPAGLAIAFTVMAFNGLGDFLRDLLDPDSKVEHD